VGAQAAAALAAPTVGRVPAAFAPDGSARLVAPERFDLDRLVRSSPGTGFAPTAYDGTALWLRLPGHVRVGPDLDVTWSGPAPSTADLRHVLMLDVDLEPLWDACDRLPSLRWVRAEGAGRRLRSPTVWPDLVGLLASTRTSYRAAQAAVRALVGDGPFPDPGAVAGSPLPGWGYRADALRALAADVDSGRVDPQRWLDPDLPDGQVVAEVTALRGFGPFSAAQLLPLLGRPGPLVLDRWLRERLGATEEQVREGFAPLGPWAGTGADLAARRG
jgi:3-methyladenine DNA glycosylase/8-oxoguanine DNA glycosylase